MPFTETPVITLRRVIIECDRCGKKKQLDVEDGAEPEDAMDLLPSWQSVWRPDPSEDQPPHVQRLYFDSRSCMSSWFATFVRVLYGGPAELPPRKRTPRKVSPLRKAKGSAEG
jgi:hypothetical protein